MNIIIGLGIAGLSFLYSKLKYSDENVTIITDDNNYGKRILVSGNGRCNISNVEVFNPNDNVHYRSHDGFIKNFFSSSDEKLFLSFLEDINLRLTCEDGRYYPFSLTASSFERNLKKFVFDDKYKKRITIIHSKVKKVDYKNKIVFTDNDNFEYDKLFISCGGISYDRSTETFLSDFEGYKPFKPALGPVVPDFTWPKRLEGQRVKGMISFNNGFDYKEYGELLFKAKKLSGICVFNASLLADDTLITFDLAEQKNNTISDRNNYEAYVPLKILETIDELPIKEGRLTFKIKEGPTFKESQVSYGGISLDYIDTKNFKYQPGEGVYIGGEALDVTGICGGYNISFAIMSGLKAGKNN